MTRSAGYHGKIPTKGDFIQRGLPGAFLRDWDRWLMEGVADLKERRGADWLAGYRSAPIWRFATPAGAFGEHAMVGVLMASVDRVGRNFPLTIAAESPPGASPFSAIQTESRMLDRMAEAALNALSVEAGKDDLDAAVAAIAGDAAEPAMVEETEEALVVTGDYPEGAIAARWLERRYGAGAAVFLSDSPVGGARKLIATRGAPTPALIAQLFEGDGSAAPEPVDVEDDLGLLAPIAADATAPVMAMTAPTEPALANDAEIDALIGSEPLAPEAPQETPAPPPETRPATDDEIDALIGSDPLSGEETTAPPAPPPVRDADSDEEDDPIAAILAGGGPES